MEDNQDLNTVMRFDRLNNWTLSSQMRSEKYVNMSYFVSTTQINYSKYKKYKQSFTLMTIRIDKYYH